MASTFNAADFAAQMRGFQASDEARQKLFADLLQQYTDLLEDHANLQNDYASERDNRRSYQKKVDLIERQYAHTQRELENNSFVLALIDGDGVIVIINTCSLFQKCNFALIPTQFQDALLHQAAGDGGSEAASRLQHAIRDHVASLYKNSGNWPIMVHMYLSLDKLSQKLASVGLLRHPAELRTFAQSFSINQSLFSIVDVGHGKERADHKIKEMLRTFSDNPTCKHIVFGGCHDAGYLLNLEQYKHDEQKAARITLLESTPALKGFADLTNFPRTRFDGIFRNQSLPDWNPSNPAFAPAPAANNGQYAIRTTTRQNSDSPGPQSASNTPITSSPATTASSLAIQANGSADSSWAQVGKGGVLPDQPISIAKKTNPKKKYAYYNAVGQRLDEVLAPIDQASRQALDARMKKAGKNLCNHWHLNNGKCNNGSACYFQHEPKLTPGELNALRYKTRSLACKNAYCENIDCYLGHQCSFERDQGFCPFPDTCNLRSTHGMDKNKYERWDEQGNQELLTAIRTK
ncbi:hypothetical protein DM02DRAFT_613295 [Periconia macrospinosa]|uniref:C3H1-type domain-containing protein n=1 Tax=Periconia macrospinosa TaxID=97972 RepID=A0A2V1DVL7_9PLEO|nr:hypothetical protein DM02DRAFT_613295 [Periconia macrospinosa]